MNYELSVVCCILRSTLMNGNIIFYHVRDFNTDWMLIGQCSLHIDNAIKGFSLKLLASGKMWVSVIKFLNYTFLPI